MYKTPSNPIKKPFLYFLDALLNIIYKTNIFSLLILLCLCSTASASTASWYDYQSCKLEGTNGRFTASGEKFDHRKLTAASWKYKFGTRLKVTNLENKKSVVVRVNDRGPAKRLVSQGRIVDLSRTAFHKIARLSNGIVPVQVEAL